MFACRVLDTQIPWPSQMSPSPCLLLSMMRSSALFWRYDHCLPAHVGVFEGKQIITRVEYLYTYSSVIKYMPITDMLLFDTGPSKDLQHLQFLKTIFLHQRTTVGAASNVSSINDLLASDPSSANPLIGYHIVKATLPAEQLTPGRVINTTDTLKQFGTDDQILTISIPMRGQVSWRDLTMQCCSLFLLYHAIATTCPDSQGLMSAGESHW